jgi:hypothetical protein
VYHGTIIIEPIKGNCIGCIHSIKGVCNLTKQIEESRCKYYEDAGKWYRTEGKS